MPGQSPESDAAASEESKRLGVKVLTTPENKKDPPPKSEEGDEEPDPAALVKAKKDPISTILTHKQAWRNMADDDPASAMKFADMAFRKYMLPKYKAVNKQFPLTEIEIDKLRTRFIAQLGGLHKENIDLDKPDPGYGTTAKVAATVEGAGAGVLGGVKTLAELQKKINDHLGPIGKPENYLIGKLIPAMGDAEHKAFEDASSISPTGAKVGAAIGHQIPAAAAAELTGAGVPSAAKGAGTAVKAGLGALKGAVETGSFTGARGGSAEEIAGSAKWGALLGAGFPVLGKLFGLGKATGKVAEAAGETPKEVSTSGAPAPTASAPKNMTDVAEIAAQKKFGKSVGELTNDERTKLPGAIKEEIQSMKAAKEEAAKAKKTAIREGKAAAAEESRAAKAEKAKQTAAKDAEKRTSQVADSGLPKDVAAKVAASENPAVAKIMGSAQEMTEKRAAERRVGTGTPPEAGERRLQARRVAPGTPAGSAGPIKLAKTEGEKLEEEIHKQVRVGEKGPSGLSEGDVMQHIMKDPKRYEAFKKLDEKAQGAEKVKARNEMMETKPTKVPEGQAGKKVRAKGGQPASPAQQAADRERQAKVREGAKKEEFGAALEKHAQELAGRYTPQSLSLMHLPDMEAAAKELPGGDTVLSALGKLRRKYKWNDDTYMASVKEWLENQFKKSQEKPSEGSFETGTAGPN